MNTGVIWVRVSSEPQLQGYSPDSQERILEEWATREGISVIKKYKLQESAHRSEKRKNFKEMLQFVIDSKADYLLAFSVKRLTRSYKDTGKLIELYDEHGVTIVAVEFNLQINKESPPIAKLMFQMLAGLAELDNEEKGLAAKANMEQKAREGKLPYLAPFGYRNIADPSDPDGRRRTVKLIPEEAEMVQRAFEFYDSGDYSIEMLSKEFKNRGFQISVRGVQEILKRPAYYGYFLFKGQLYKWDQPPIISKELFDQVQLRLSQACTSPHKNSRKWFCFKKFLRCGYCGGSYTAQEQAGITYYNCNTRATNIERCQQLHYFPEEQINSIIASEIGSLRIDSGWMEKLKAQLKEGRERDDIRAANERKRLEIERAKFRNRADRLIDAWTDGLISKEEYKAKRSEYSERIAQVESVLKATEKLNTDYKEQGAEILDLLRHFPEYYRKADLRGKQALLNICLERLTLRGTAYQIDWRPPFHLLFPLVLLESAERGE